MTIMQKLRKRFKLLALTREDGDVDPAAQAQAVVSAYHAALGAHDLTPPESGFSLSCIADSDGDADGDGSSLYGVYDSYASWYIVVSGTTANVVAFYAYPQPEWCEEECFAYSEDLAEVLRDAGLAPTEKAARAEWLVKALNAEPKPVEKRGYVPIAKSDVQRYTLGVAYPHSEVDSHGDFTDEDELEQSAWNFMRDVVSKGEAGVGTDHADGTDGAAQVVESYIYRGPTYDVEVGDGETVTIKTGDWLVGAVWTPEAWERVEKGEITGWSIQGLAFVDPDAELPEAA